MSPKDRNRPTASSAAAVQSRSRSNRPSAQTLSSIAHQHRHYRDSNHQGVYPHLGRQIVAVSMIVTLSACATTALQIDCTATCMATRCYKVRADLGNSREPRDRQTTKKGSDTSEDPESQTLPQTLSITDHQHHRPSASQTISITDYQHHRPPTTVRSDKHHAHRKRHVRIASATCA